jgi:hypothetical protein
VRRSLLCLAILLTLPWAVHADQTSAAEPVLDLSFDPALTATPSAAPALPQAVAASPAREAERRFSVGLDIKSRREIGSPAARATAERPGPPTLADKVEGIVERSTIGVTGTYRF